jgi:hypothetical protein
MYIVNLAANHDTPVNSRLSADVGLADKGNEANKANEANKSERS